MLNDATMFGATPLDPANELVRLPKLIQWDMAEEEHEKNFPSLEGQPRRSARMAWAR